MNLEGKQLEALECREALCLSAGAGTGKTLTLVHKYMDYLEKAGSSRYVLALTFTDKAASEMRARARRILSERTDGKADAMLEDLHWSTILTFHSFCAQIIRNYPLETGIDPNFIVLDDAQQNIILEEAMENVLSSSDEAVAGALARAMSIIEVRRMRKLLRNLYRKRGLTAPYFTRMAGDPSASIEAARKELIRDACFMFATGEHARSAIRSLNELAAAHPSEPFLAVAKDDLETILARASPEEVENAVTHLLEKVPRGNYGSTKYLGNDVGTFKEGLKALKEAIKKSKLKLLMDGDDPAVTAKIIEFLGVLGTINGAYLKEVDRLKRERNGIDYDDMLQAIHALFQRDPDFVRKNFTARYKYVLIDETQDTDQVQLDIVKAILGDGPDARDRLFVVGDPKQSIYFFRGVDVSLFKFTRDYVVNELKGTYKALNVNHRSAPQIVGLVNAVFEKMMSRDERPWEFRYETVGPTPKRNGHQGSAEMRFINVEAPNVVERYIAEGNHAAAIIREVMAGPKLVYEEQKDESFVPRRARYKDITILLRTRTNLFYYERALRLAGIPYRVHRGQGFFARQEVLDLYNLLRFLSNQTDDKAFYGILRSPYFGLSDSQLHAVGMASQDHWHERLKKAAGEDARLRPAHDRLERWLGYARHEPVGDLAGRIITESNIMAVYGGLEGGKEMASNLNKLRDRLVSLQSAGFVTLEAALESLETSITEEQKDGQAQVEEDADAVLLMTVHAAKGLEWPILIVPEIDLPLRNLETEAVEVDRQLGLGVKVVSPIDLDLAPDPVMRHIQLQWALKSEAEFQRLLYVAMTRARDHLYMTGVYWTDMKEGKSIEDAASWLDLITLTMGLTRDGAVSGRVPYTDSLNYSNQVRTAFIEPDLGGQWSEGTEYTVPEVLRGLPMEQPPVQLAERTKKRIKPSAIGITREDGVVDTEDCLEEDDENEGNKNFGTMVHQVFQGRPAQVVLMEHGIDDDKMAQQIDDMYARFMSCELMRDVVEERLEIPYNGRRGEFDEIGQIDRLVKKKDGSWVLIDYKTGGPSDEALEDKKQYYRGQMNAYARAVEELIGQRPKAYLYFTHNGKIVEM